MTEVTLQQMRGQGAQQESGRSQATLLQSQRRDVQRELAAETTLLSSRKRDAQQEPGAAKSTLAKLRKRDAQQEPGAAKSTLAKLRKRDAQPGMLQHGGKRNGAGRKPKRGRAGSPHGKRPEIKPHQPVHVVMRVVAEVGSLRRRAIYKAMRDATITAALRERFRIVHVSVQRNHVHMLVEAATKKALSRGMQGFEISAARNINTMLGSRKHRRSGQVFADRYYAKVIKSPRQAHHALRYTLCNWRHHDEDQRGLASTWLIDPFSTGILFPDWKELQDKALMWPLRETYDPLVVFRPRTWLLREAWKQYGPISARDVPGAAR